MDASVYLLTDHSPALLPVPTGDNGLSLDHSAPATASLLDDLRSDRGMDWVPARGWLTKVRIDAAAPQLAFDLAVDATGARSPSRVAAGLDLAVTATPVDRGNAGRVVAGLAFSIIGIGGILLLVRRQPPVRTT